MKVREYAMTGGKHIRNGIVLAMIMAVTFLLCACGGVSADDISAAVESQKVDDVVSVVEQYAEQKDKADLDAALVEQFKTLCESTDYSDYEFMDQVIAKIKDKDLKAELQDTIEDNCTNKVIAFTEGEWVRRDLTDQDGIVLSLKWNKDDGTGILTETKNAPKTNFKVGDIKWKDVSVISMKEFSFKDLSRSDEVTDQIQGLGKINYENKTIKCQISDVDKDYSLGNTQVWVKKDAIDTEKEHITKKDFQEWFREKDYKKDYYYWWYEDTFVRDKKDRETLLKEDKNDKIPTVRDVTFGDNRKKVISAYGYGHIIYQSYNSDPFHNLAESAVNRENKASNRGFMDILKQSKYAALYTNKKGTAFLKMYFNKNDKLMLVVFAPESYDDFVKSI